MHRKPRKIPWYLWLAAVPVLCCVSSVALTVYLRVTIDEHPVYQGALLRAGRSGQVRAKLGTPLRVTKVEGARLKPFNDASIQMRVAGPKGEGTLYVAAQGPDPESLEVFNLYVVPDATGTKLQLSGSTAGD